MRRRRRSFGLPPAGLVRPTDADYRKLGNEIDRALERHDIAVWFPRCIDHANGGFTANYSNTWQPLPGPIKGVVFQARMTWFTAQVSERMPATEAARFQNYSLHGLKFLREQLWDSKRGGFFWELNNDGTLPADGPAEKYVYGEAFAIYACANVARVTQNPDALELGQRAFRCLDERAHDSRHGGYHESLDGDGHPLLRPPSRQVRNPLKTPYGYKSLNTNLHLLESYMELYRVWPDPSLRARLEELFHIVRDRMFVLPGCLNQFYTADFQPIPDLDSYGHDVEAAYLLV